VVDLPSSGTVVAIRRGDDTAAREYSPPATPSVPVRRRMVNSKLIACPPARLMFTKLASEFL